MMEETDIKQSGPGMFRRHVLYPDRYTWFVFASALDLLMTAVILNQGGREVNAVAEYVINRWGNSGVILFKFGLVIFVVLICEIVGKKRYALGRRLATWAIVVPAFAVLVSFVLLFRALPVWFG